MIDRKFTDDDVIKALDICDKFDFFYGQRAGRELWFEKPVEVQNEDIRNFADGIAFVKDFINRQRAEIESLNAVNADMTESLRLAAEANKDMSVELDAMRGAANSYKMHCEEAQAELEDLREIVFMDRSEAIKNLKAETIKEFWSELKRRSTLDPRMVSTISGDTLAKEMTEGGE